MSDHKIILRNFEGYVATYEEPTDYLPSDAAKFKGERRTEPGQEGVHGLLEGKELFIKPEGFDEVHERQGIQHRLKDASKWKPLGIGDGTEKYTGSTASDSQGRPITPRGRHGDGMLRHSTTPDGTGSTASPSPRLRSVPA